MVLLMCCPCQMVASRIRTQPVGIRLFPYDWYSGGHGIGEALGENKSSLRNTESRAEAYDHQGTHGCNHPRDLKRSGLFGGRLICAFQRTARTAPGNAGGEPSDNASATPSPSRFRRARFGPRQPSANA